MLTLLSVSCLSLLLPALRPPLVAHARCLPPAAQDGGRDGARNSPTATGTVDASRGGSRGRGDSRGRGSSRGRGGSRGRGRGGRGWYTSGGVPRIGQLESAAEVLAAFEEHGHKFRPQDVASSWNALGKLVRRPAERQWLTRETDERLAPLKEQTLQAVPTFPAKALAISAHGLASIESRTRWRAGNEVWRAVAERGVDVVREFNPQELSNTAWAFATAKHPTPAALLDVIAAEAAERVREFNPQELSNTAWAFATAGHVAPALLDAIAAEAVGRVREFNDQELTNTAWAFATAGHAAPALLDAIAVEATGRVGDFNEQGLSNTAWAFATAGHAAPALLDAIAAEAAGRVGDFTPQALANTAWACAVADSCADALFDDPLFTARCLLFEQAFSPSELCQLHQWQLWRDERSADWPPLPPSLAQRCRDAFGEGGSRPSQLQSQVADALRAMGLQVQEEVRTSLGHSLDAVVLVDGREVGIEVDGPSHFVGRTPTGSTALKRRQLKAAGWTLLPVPYWEWAEIGRSNPQARRRLRFEYLSSLLEPRMTQPAEGGAPTAQGESES